MYILLVFQGEDDQPSFNQRLFHGRELIINLVSRAEATIAVSATARSEWEPELFYSIPLFLTSASSLSQTAGCEEASHRLS